MQRRFPKGLAAATVAGLFVLALAALPAAEDPPRFSAWSAPVNLGPVVNSTDTEAGTYISRDGLSLYFGSTRPGGVGAAGTFDIWVSHRAATDETWGEPVNLGPGVNTIYNEQTPAVSIDGHRMYFARDGSGGYGRQDLYVSRRQSALDDVGWEAGVNLGTGVNSPADEAGPGLFEDDASGMLTLYFNSNRVEGGLGLEDIYVTTAYPEGEFGAAAVELALSGPFRDVRPFVRRDGLEMYFDSNRPGSNGSQVDLWMSSRASIWDAWSEPVRLPDYINSSAVDARPVVSFDGTELYFHSTRPGGLGFNDIYVCTRTRITGRIQD